MFNKWFKVIRKTILLIGLIFVSFSFFINLVLWLNYWDKATPLLRELPEKEIALILGTSPYIEKNKENLFFTYRIKAAWEVYMARKADKLLLSGWSDGGYNEAKEMKERLVEMGIPEKDLILDEKSQRTLESIKRAKEIFGYNDFIIVTQPFHAKRALFLASLNGIDSYAYLAKSPPFPLGFKTYFREVFARLKIFLDILNLDNF